MKRILLIKRMLLSWYLLHLDNKRNLTIDTIVSMFPRTGGAKQDCHIDYKIAVPRRQLFT